MSTRTPASNERDESVAALDPLVRLGHRGEHVFVGDRAQTVLPTRTRVRPARTVHIGVRGGKRERERERGRGGQQSV